MYTTGKGSVVLRGQYHLERIARNAKLSGATASPSPREGSSSSRSSRERERGGEKVALVIDELPYMVVKSGGCACCNAHVILQINAINYVTSLVALFG